MRFQEHPSATAESSHVPACMEGLAAVNDEHFERQISRSCELILMYIRISEQFYRFSHPQVQRQQQTDLYFSYSMC